MLGQQVAVLVDEMREAGTHAVVWDGRGAVYQLAENSEKSLSRAVRSVANGEVVWHSIPNPRLSW